MFRMGWAQRFNAIFQGRSDRLSGQFARYTVAGGIAFVADFSTLIFLTEQVGINYLLSSVCGFSLGVLINYQISIHWVFKQRSFNSRLSEFIVFTIIGITGLGLHTLSMWLLTEAVGLFYVTSKVISTALVFLYNFSARRYLVFNARTAGRETS